MDCFWIVCNEGSLFFYDIMKTMLKFQGYKMLKIIQNPVLVTAQRQLNQLNFKKCGESEAFEICDFNIKCDSWRCSRPAQLFFFYLFSSLLYFHTFTCRTYYASNSKGTFFLFYSQILT